MSNLLYLRRDYVGKLLLLNCECTRMKGAIALGSEPCDIPRWHIAVRTDNFQHPHCIDLTLTNGRLFSEGQCDTAKSSKCFEVTGKSGSFHLKLRWWALHSPYPEIQNMEVWCFGVYLGKRSYPKANDDYLDIAAVEINGKGAVTVNGKYAGIWLEFT